MEILFDVENLGSQQILPCNEDSAKLFFAFFGQSRNNFYVIELKLAITHPITPSYFLCHLIKILAAVSSETRQKSMTIHNLLINGLIQGQSGDIESDPIILSWVIGYSLSRGHLLEGNEKKTTLKFFLVCTFEFSIICSNCQCQKFSLKYFCHKKLGHDSFLKIYCQPTTIRRNFTLSYNSQHHFILLNDNNNNIII